MPDFASNPSFVGPLPEPSDQYEGQPTKVAMTEAQRANGFVPDQPIAAEHLNAELNALSARAAGGVPYTPAQPTDWGPTPPAMVAAALDALGARHWAAYDLPETGVPVASGGRLVLASKGDQGGFSLVNGTTILVPRIGTYLVMFAATVRLTSTANPATLRVVVGNHGGSHGNQRYSTSTDHYIQLSGIEAFATAATIPNQGSEIYLSNSSSDGSIRVHNGGLAICRIGDELWDPGGGT